uniref:Uncharacterized protein n=1 Tax=Meloidogyne floridensis TaxID=298350 RepID=A0A915NUH7_9BILA
LDEPVIGMNQRAMEALVNCKEKELIIVEGATHLFEEAGTLDNELVPQVFDTIRGDFLFKFDMIPFEFVKIFI